MTKILYNLFIKAYPFIINLAAPFNEKAKLWAKGRKGIFDRLQQAISSGEKIIWMHCSSLGEFEQGRPVIEKLKESNSACKILLTFFSPSGFEVRKNYSGADYVFYLPMDSRQNAKRFFEIVDPSLIIFVKYEFWYYYLQESKQRNTPLLLISAIFRKTQPFFKAFGNVHRKMLHCFSHIFVQDQQAFDLLSSIGLQSKASISGDTRFDRVIEIAEKFNPVSSIETFCSGFNVIVAGSTWAEDDKVLAHFANLRADVKFIIAPHNIIKSRLNECLSLYKHAVLFSTLTESVIDNTNTIIIDNIGMLSSLYNYSTVSYVGGGFGKDGIHNALEAAVYGKPIVFGPVYEKFIEAVGLVENGGAFSVNNALDLEAVFNRLLEKKDDYDIACQASFRYVHTMKGATAKIISFIQEKRLLTN